MADNKEFIFRSLRALEKHGKIQEIHWLTESYFCKTVLGCSLQDEIGLVRPVLILEIPAIDKDFIRKDHNEYARYYTDSIILDGKPFLVSNYWTDKGREVFLHWLKTVLENDFEELPEIEETIRGEK